MFGPGGGEALTRLFGKFSEDKVVREAKERGKFLRGEGVGVFERDPLGARKIRGGDDARTLGEIREGFVGGFEREENASGFERRDGEHFAANFEDEVVAPLNLFGGVGKAETKFSNGFNGVYGHGDLVEQSQFAA